MQRYQELFLNLHVYAILYFMKKSILFIMTLMLLSLTGCDFIRSVAGRPTSKDIEKKRIAIIKAEEQALQKRLDSISLAEKKVVDDSLAAFDFFKNEGVIINGAKRLGGLAGMELEYEYYIVIGAFLDRSNAEKQAESASACGYSTVLISCRSGMTAVGATPSNTIAPIKESYKKLIQESFCPKDAWILVKN